MKLRKETRLNPSKVANVARSILVLRHRTSHPARLIKIINTSVRFVSSKTYKLGLKRLFTIAPGKPASKILDSKTEPSLRRLRIYQNPPHRKAQIDTKLILFNNCNSSDLELDLNDRLARASMAIRIKKPIK